MPTLVDALGRVKRVKPGVGVEQFVEIGPVKNVYGKPSARAQVAELCLYWMCRRESVRLGVKIVGLKEEFYDVFKGDDDEESIHGVVEGGTWSANVASTRSVSVSGGRPTIKQEISDEDDTMSLA